MRKIHELDVVRERLKQWDSVQAKMEHTLLAMRQTAHEIGARNRLRPDITGWSKTTAAFKAGEQT